MVHPVLDVMAGHRSVRDFTSEPMPAEHLDCLMNAAQRASTDAGAQMGTFIRITDSERRSRLAEIAGGQKHVETAAEFFVVCADVHRLRKLVEHRGGVWGDWRLLSLLFAIGDATLMAQNMALAAESLGYGICYIGGVQNDPLAVAEMLALPAGAIPVFGLCIGKPTAESRTTRPRPRIPREAAFFENAYPPLEDELLDACYDAMSSGHPSGDWYESLWRYFTPPGGMPRREVKFRELLRRQGIWPDDEG